MIDYMLGDLIYFRKLLISIKTCHLSVNDVVERVNDNSNLVIYLDDLKKNDPNIENIIQKIEYEIDKLCDHDIQVDWVDDIVGDDLIKIKYCSICELNMYRFKHDHCYSCR